MTYSVSYMILFYLVLFEVANFSSPEAAFQMGIMYDGEEAVEVRPRYYHLQKM